MQCPSENVSIFCVTDISFRWQSKMFKRYLMFEIRPRKDNQKSQLQILKRRRFSKADSVVALYRASKLVLTSVGSDDRDKVLAPHRLHPPFSLSGTPQPLLSASLEDIASISASFFRAGQFLWQLID